jgi:hypothetical protein
MTKSVTGLLAFASSLAISAIAPAATPAPTREYFKDKFAVERVLDWGERPVWSADSKRIAFTVDDENLGPAYEMDVATRKVRCLTCRWGANGHVARIYYLADGSFLIEGPASLESAEATRGTKPVQVSKTYMYWMPADASLPPQPLGAVAGGEIALDYDHSTPGVDRIAWGEFAPKYRMLMGEVVNDGKRAYLVNRTVLYDGQPTDPKGLVTYTETYDFIDDGKSVLFFTGEKGQPYNGMYKVDIASGKMSKMPTDGQHNETHSFPDVRFGLEESNRATDPSGPYRGMSGHRIPFLALLLKWDKVPDAEADAIGQKYGGKTFDLYVSDWATGERRRLTNTSEVGGEAHQSSPARDGSQIVWAVRPAATGKFTGKSGLYVGTFSATK